MIGILEALDCKDTPKAREIEDTVENVGNKFDHIQEAVVEKQHALNAAVTASQDVNHNIEALLNWVNDTEVCINNSHLRTSTWFSVGVPDSKRQIYSYF